MRILVCGSRNWGNRQLIKDVLDLWVPPGIKPTIVHGACPTGADAIANQIALDRKWNIERHPAKRNEHGRAAGPIRNQEMADLGADICLAFQVDGSRGTQDMINRASA